jgi:endonuclease/exonuclease/phosphatase family metal-dependent hydrolase
VVRGFDADIVVVLEAWRDHDGHGLLDSLTADGYRIETTVFSTLTISGSRPRHDVPGEGHVEVAICTRLPILASRELPIGHIRRDQFGARAALMCTIDVEGTEIDVVAVHVSSKLWKLAPARQIRALRPQLPGRDRNAVVAGDFNLWGPPVAAMFKGWERAVLGRTYPAHRPHSQIDHILVRDNIAILSGEVLAPTPSDHRPIRARLRVTTGPRPGEAGTVG